MMKETYAEELKNVQIRVEATESLASSIKVTRLDTGEAIENVESISIEVQPGRINWVTLTLLRINEEKKRVEREAVTCNDPIIDVVGQVKHADILDL